MATKNRCFLENLASGGLPQFAQVVAYGMKRKCDQVQSHQCVGQPLFAVSEVMLHVITVSFQQVKPFVFNLPARPTGCHNLGCIGFGDIKRGDEAKALRWLAVADSTNLKFNVIYLQRIVAISDRQLPCNTILINQIRLFASWCFFDHPLGWPCNTIEITEKCFMRTFFDAEDEIVTGLCNLFAHRVIGIQVIALHLAFSAGLRVSELTALTLDNLEQPAISTIRVMGKGRRERVLPLWDETRSTLADWLNIRPAVKDNHLFLNARGTAELTALTLDNLEQPAISTIRVMGKGRRERVLPLWDETRSTPLADTVSHICFRIMSRP